MNTQLSNCYLQNYLATNNIGFANAGWHAGIFSLSPLHQALLFFSLLIVGLLTTNPVYANNKRLALVIGNADYKVNALSNSVNDAEDIARKLKKLDFDVMHYSNLDKRSMNSAIREFSDKSSAYDVVLFYFAGHGVQVDGENYLIPVDIEFDIHKEEVEDEAIRARKVLSMMDAAPNKTNLFILDACRNNPFRGFSRGVERGLASLDGAAGTLIAYATSPGSTAADGDRRNGIYTEHLLKNMDKPGLTVEQMLKKVRIEVLQATNDQQTPWENSSLRGDFCFAGCENTEVLAEKAQREIAKKAQKEQEKKASKIQAEFEAYKQQVEQDKQAYQKQLEASAKAKVEIEQRARLPRELTKKEQKALDKKLAAAVANEKRLQEALEASNHKAAAMAEKLGKANTESSTVIKNSAPPVAVEPAYHPQNQGTIFQMSGG